MGRQSKQAPLLPEDALSTPEDTECSLDQCLDYFVASLISEQVVELDEQFTQ